MMLHTIENGANAVQVRKAFAELFALEDQLLNAVRRVESLAFRISGADSPYCGEDPKPEVLSLVERIALLNRSYIDAIERLHKAAYAVEKEIEL